MNKFLSIFATTGLLAAFAGVAQAADPVDVSASGTVVEMCTLTVPGPGSIGSDPTFNQIGTTWGRQPELETKCNAAGGHTIAVGLPSFTINGSAPATSLGYEISGGYSAGRGVYAGIGDVFGTGTPSIITISSTTSNGGDRFLLNAKIKAPATTLLIAGTYVATIPVTLTPQ